MTVRLGTRSSRLALWQAERVAELLRGRGAECEIVTIETRGDAIPDRPLPEIGGDGAFTERIERSLRESRIDIAVHSLKDLPVEDLDDLCVGAVLGREEAREVLISRQGLRLAALPPGAMVGSSSTRRQAQVLTLRPDLVVRPIRGNVETRIRKVESGEFDATLLAGVGVLRLGLAGKIAEWLEVNDILPAPGQGAIAVQCRTADAATRRLLAGVDEPALRAETDAERAFLRALGGGCSAPVGAFAQARGGRLRLRGRVSALDGSRVVEVDGEGDDPAALAALLAGRALRGGAAALIAAADRGGRSSHGLAGLRIVVTRAHEQTDDLSRLLAAADAVPISLPMIRTTALADTRALDAAIASLGSYRWVLFTSANGVEHFMKRMKDLRPGAAWQGGSPLVGAVGPGTADSLDGHGVGVDFLPAIHTGVALADGLVSRENESLEGARLLLPRAQEGNQEGAAVLRRHGALVDDIPVYRTDPCILSPHELSVLKEGADAVLFFSGFAVSAWCDQAGTEGLLADTARRAVVACIGPTTAAAARGRGMRVDVEAPMHSSAGLVAALGKHFARVRGAIL